MSVREVMLVALCGILVIPAGVAAQVATQTPAEIAAVNQIDKRYDSLVPRELSFLDDRGYRVKLGDFLGERPVVISLNYSDCPMLCNVMLREFVVAASGAQLRAGEDFEFVSISIDPQESVQRAASTKAKYVELSGDPESAKGWHFLTGERTSIDAAAQAVGVSYVYLPDRKEYSHPAVFVVVTPDGRISQYLQGAGLESETLRLTLVDASQGKLGTATDWFVLACFVYDPNSNSYAFAARRVMQWGAGFTVVALVVGLVPFWLRRPRSAESVDHPAGSREIEG